MEFLVNFSIPHEQVKTDDLKNVLNTQMYSPQDGNAHLGRFTVDPKYTDFIGEFDFIHHLLSIHLQ